MNTIDCDAWNFVEKRFRKAQEMYGKPGLDASDAGMAYTLATCDPDGNFITLTTWVDGWCPDATPGPVNSQPAVTVPSGASGLPVAGQVRVHHLGMAGVQQRVDLAYRVQGTASRSVGVLLRLQVRLEDRLQDQHCCHLHHAVFNRRNPQRSLLAVRLGNVNPPDRLRDDTFFVLSSSASSPNHFFTPYASMSSNVWPSTPAAPWFKRQRR